MDGLRTKDGLKGYRVPRDDPGGLETQANGSPLKPHLVRQLLLKNTASRQAATTSRVG